MNTVQGFKDTIQWYDENASSYAKAGKDLVFTPAVERFISYLPAHAQILDAGCGAGRDTAIFAAKGFAVVGLDISEGLLNEARRSYSNINFIAGNFLSLPFENNIFHGVWAHASLVHLESIENTRRALGEFYRVLKSGGILHVMVKEQQGNIKTATVSDKLSNHDRFFQYYTQGELVSILTELGFSIVFADRNVADSAGRGDTRWIWLVAQKN